jgi:hypothetical protein
MPPKHYSRQTKLRMILGVVLYTVLVTAGVFGIVLRAPAIGVPLMALSLVELFAVCRWAVRNNIRWPLD